MIRTTNISAREAVTRALAAGASVEEIKRETERQARHKGTAPQRNMIRALSSMPALNDREDWVRLAAALRC